MITNGKPKGFTLLETIVTMTVFFIVMLAVYTMVVHYGDVSQTEHSRLKMNQESRFMASVFASELKDAGAVLTAIEKIPTFSHFPSEQIHPSFNGIFPLNNTNYPDGIIIATGDPGAVFSLTADLNPGNSTLSAKSEIDAVNASFPWGPGDIGVVINEFGYYIFAVNSVDATSFTINIREWSKPVYYSGLLSNSNYSDPLSSNPGNAITYDQGSPVIRLTNFAMYLFKEVTLSGSGRKVRQMIRVSDTMGNADPLAQNSTAQTSIISENIYDMQISYVAYENFQTVNRTTTIDPNHHYFAGGSTSTSHDNLLTDIQSVNLKQIDITMVSLTDEFGGVGRDTERTLQVPRIGDLSSGYELPKGKYMFKLSSISIEPRNFNIQIHIIAGA